MHAGRIPIKLFDAHVHLSGPGSVDQAAAAGMTAVRDAGIRSNAGYASGSRQNGAVIVMSSRWALYKEGGYGARFGMPVSGRQQIRDEILKLRKAGADIIKIMASGVVSLRQPGRITAGGFDRGELQWIVRAAAECGLAVMAHANGERAIVDAAEAGVRSIEHGFFMTKTAAEVLAKKNVFWVPTTGALARAAEKSGDTEAKSFVRGLIESHLQMIAFAHELGIGLAAGTDYVLPAPGYREAFDAELAYFKQAGIPDDAVCRIAGDGGARLMNIGSEREMRQ